MSRSPGKGPVWHPDRFLELKSTLSLWRFGLQEPALKLWDLRELRDDSSTGLPRLLHSFGSHREPVSGFSMRGNDIVSYTASHIGICSVQPPLTPQLALTQPLNAQGGRDSAPIAGLGLLNYSHLLVLATEDGSVKICC